MLTNGVVDFAGLIMVPTLLLAVLTPVGQDGADTTIDVPVVTANYRGSSIDEVGNGT
jgi:hypothetical protein